jgi:acetyl-CoA acetyltransferase
MLTRTAYQGVLEDAGIKPDDIDFLYFGNCGWGRDLDPKEGDPGQIGQMNVRGQVAFAPLVQEGLFPKRVPCINVEGACATGSLAFHSAWKDILAGTSNVCLAMGAEKTVTPGYPDVTYQGFLSGTDHENVEHLLDFNHEVAKMVGKEWNKGGKGTIFMETYATQAAYHMWKNGTTQRQLAIAASKNHFHGSLNPLAQYRFEISPEKVLNDYEVSWPLTRSMCAPLGDGAAAAILCSEEYLSGLPYEIRKRALKVSASVISGGYERDPAQPSLSHWAAQRAYKIAEIGPEDIDVAEVHDATAFCEIYQVEMMGFCPLGEGGKFVESGATRFDGKKPINTSGGLESKGHPIGATGLSQINEIAMQLRGEAGDRQVHGAEIGLVENGGGVVGLEEFCCGVTILQKSEY